MTMTTTRTRIPTTRTRIPTTDLTGRALDYAVALAEGHRVEPYISENGRPVWAVHIGMRVMIIGGGTVMEALGAGYYQPSVDPKYGHPIMEREGISLRAIRKPGHAMDGQWLAMKDHGNTANIVQWAEFLFKDTARRLYWRGPTMLVAAMRCFVSSNLGNHVDVPKELLS